MALGQAIKQDFVLLLNNPDVITPSVELPDYNRECCFQLPVLAEIGGTDDLKNDRSSKFFIFDKGYTGAIIILQRSTGPDWEDIVVLSDNTFGLLFEYGFEVNPKNEKLMGFIISWKLVLAVHGEGTYRMKCVADTITGGEAEFYSFEYCLKAYTAYRADKTVRINFWQTGVNADLDDDTKTKDFGIFTAFGQIRLPMSFFGSDTSTYETTYTRYQNGQQKWLTDTQDQFFMLECTKLPFFIHDHLRSDILQADQISITDYNAINANKKLINKYVRRESSYEPPWPRGSLFSSVKVKFTKEYKNNVHKRC
jgi:hypothetical protein